MGAFTEIIRDLKARRDAIGKAIDALESIDGGAAPITTATTTKAVTKRRGRAASVASNGAPGLAALRVVKKAGRAGIIGSALLKAIGAASDFGIGSVKAAIQDELKRAAASELIDTCVREERKGRGMMWYPGEQLGDAIEALEGLDE